jgi:[ribosomal protein S5]-alanine N-acetyltransferase
MPLPTLRTPRLTLRPWELDDIDTLHALWTRPEVRRYLWDDVVISRTRAEETVRDTLDTASREGIGGWVAIDIATGALAGFVGLIRREPGDPELIYGLAPEWWGRGMATEASRAVLAYAFGPLSCERVTAAMDVPNAASVRVMERLGMRFTHRGLLNGLDTLFYEMRRDEFATASDTALR